jgi:hypothetical protein
MTDFLASGSPRVLSKAIEAQADQQRVVSALVVPWESSDAALSMAVTSARADGWAIEHTNLGTIRLTDLGNDRTRVTIAGGATDVEEKLRRVFDDFAQQIRKRFEIAS